MAYPSALGQRIKDENKDDAHVCFSECSREIKLNQIELKDKLLVCTVTVTTTLGQKISLNQKKKLKVSKRYTLAARNQQCPLVRKNKAVGWALFFEIYHSV